MTIEAGRLRHRISLQRKIQTQDATTGAVTETWQEVAKLWAAIEPLSAREFIQSQTMQAQIVARIVIRHREDIDATMRAVHQRPGKPDKIYNIHGVLADKDSGLEYLTLPVSAGVNQGQ